MHLSEKSIKLLFKLKLFGLTYQVNIHIQSVCKVFFQHFKFSERCKFTNFSHMYILLITLLYGLIFFTKFWTFNLCTYMHIHIFSLFMNLQIIHCSFICETAHSSLISVIIDQQCFYLHFKGILLNFWCIFMMISKPFLANQIEF